MLYSERHSNNNHIGLVTAHNFAERLFIESEKHIMLLFQKQNTANYEEIFI